ncbi:hypothetical protein [Leptothrix ochracea]|uniref:hypothetical protein n=1 Tax=Leptothrix ochracea TaxID=735331 RepID=UPI0034E247D9
MLNQFESFYAQPKLQAVTLSLCLACLFFAVPFLQRRARSKLTDRQKELYDPIAKDILAQVLFLFGGVVIYSIVAVVRSDLSFISGDALPFVSVLGSLSAFWNIRRAELAIRNAIHGSNEKRKVRLADVYEKNLNAYSAGLVAFLYGLIVVVLVLLVPQELSTWLWLVNFLVTGPAIYALSWSISSLAVATEYARNPKLGRSNKSFQQTATSGVR